MTSARRACLAPTAIITQIALRDNLHPCLYDVKGYTTERKRKREGGKVEGGVAQDGSRWSFKPVVAREQPKRMYLKCLSAAKIAAADKAHAFVDEHTAEEREVARILGQLMGEVVVSFSDGLAQSMREDDPIVVDQELIDEVDGAGEQVISGVDDGAAYHYEE